MGPRHSRSRASRFAVLVALCLFLGMLALPPSQAQGPLSCLNCDFELVTVEWNGSAIPGAVTNGVFEIRNTGESRDQYRIEASADNESWTVETDPSETNEVPPGSGIFAEDANTAQFRLRVLVPNDAPANSRVTITVRVESLNGEDLAKETTVEARAKQVYDWSLDCTPFVSIQKTNKDQITLTATNLGNGRDRAEVLATPVQGIVPTDPKAFEAAAGETVQQTIDIGVGLRADDGTYEIRWDLRSGGDPNALAQCATAVEVTGGGGNETDDGGDSEEGPLPSTLLVLLTVLAIARVRQKRAA